MVRMTKNLGTVKLFITINLIEFVFDASIVIDLPKNERRCFFSLSTISVLPYSRHLSEYGFCTVVQMPC